MANTKSAEKRNRQSAEARQRNRAQRSRLRTAVKGLRAAVESGDAARARAGIRLGIDHEDVGVRAIGNPHLGSV